ncbi:MAG: hypothetical protein KAG56_03050 [Sulfurovaceae bacterium]|nr:hypothetical protein [Sulfurovaceae bacterium]
MLRLLIILSIFLNISYAQGQRYFIQLGSFKDQRLLERNIANIPSSLRSHIVVVKSNHWLIPFAYHTPNKTALYRKLSAYKRYFPDATISSASYILKHKVVLNYVQQKSYTKRVSTPRPPRIAYHQVPRYQTKIYQDEQYIAPEATVVYHPEVIISQPQPIITLPEVYEEEQSLSLNENVIYSENITSYEEELIVAPAPVAYSQPKMLRKRVSIPSPRVMENTGDIERYHHFSSHMLSGQHYFLAYKATASNPNLLIKVKFGTHSVSYQPIIGDMQMVDANYIVDSQRLYMYADNFSENGAYSKIEAQRVDHILVSSWAGGNKLNTLRYYFKIGDAKRYLNIVQSEDKLSEAIEEGLDYDWGLDL